MRMLRKRERERKGEKEAKRDKRIRGGKER